MTLINEEAGTGNFENKQSHIDSEINSMATTSSNYTLVASSVSGKIEKQLLNEQHEEASYSLLSKEKLIAELKHLIDHHTIEEIGNKAELIKIAFYKKHRAEIEQKRTKFIEEGGLPEDFKLMPDELELTFKKVMAKYREAKIKYSVEFEKQKKINLQKKNEIIEELKNLILKQESLNKTFEEFKELQQRFRAIGPVPQNQTRELLINFNAAVDQFYEYIKINKELRDLDLRKNLEAKLALIEKAESLLLCDNIVAAFAQLQELHEQWREIGPEPREKRDEIWKKFQDITAVINKKHHDYFIQIKEQEAKNFVEKSAICEKIEKLIIEDFVNFGDQKRKTEEVLALQKKWQEIGAVPKKESLSVLRRYRKACNAFFKKKREFMISVKEKFASNLSEKIKLCEKVESFHDTNDWEKATREVIQLQRKWKEIGPVLNKESTQVWERFKKACDMFFQKKEEYQKSLEQQYVKNLDLKKNLLAEFEQYKHTNNPDEDMQILKDFQQKWASIGFVPATEKEAIQRKYTDICNRWFNGIKIDESKKQLMIFKNKISSLASEDNASKLLSAERDKLIKILRQLEHDVVKLENNMGFFKASKNADIVLADLQAKIDKSKQEIKILSEKINIIDRYKTKC